MNFEIVNYHDLMSWYSDAADDAAQDLAFEFIGQMVRDGDDTTVPTIMYIDQAEKFYELGLGFFTISDEQKLGRCIKAWKRAYEAYYAPDDGTDEEAPESPEEATANRADAWDEFISAYMEAEKYYAECAKNLFKDFITKPELGGDEVMAAIAARRYFDQALLATDVYSALMHADQIHTGKSHLFMNRMIAFMAGRARRGNAQVLEWYKEFKKADAK